MLLIVGGGLAGLAALPKHRDAGGRSSGGGGGGVSQITDDSHFYGESPGVYPSREFSWKWDGRGGGEDGANGL